MKKTRVMVEENDPQWQRFWNAYPHRVAKKDARKAWFDLNPSPEVVDRIVAALTWQAAEWAKKADWYTPPYPASWLRAERWTDEAPRGHQVEPKYLALCRHTPKCGSLKQCLDLERESRVSA